MSMIAWLWLTSVIAAGLILIIATRSGRLWRLGSEVSLALLLASFPFLFVAEFNWGVVAMTAVVQAFMLVLPSRLMMGRLDKEFLLASTQRNVLIGFGLVSVVMAVQTWGLPVLREYGIDVMLVVSIGVSLFFLTGLLWNLRHYRVHEDAQSVPVKDLPTVSICIPARNEDHALTECLQAVVASDYPKLEVLVLDDCSHDQTSSIIRSFAHDGVRFVQGDEPASGWLGKNQAMQTLAQQASGEYLLFMSVDTHLAPRSVSRIVTYILQHKLQMVSVLPQNRMGFGPASLFMPLQYFWRIVAPITKRRVPVSSKFWAVNAKSLRGLGGFASVSHKVVPEESFARRLLSRQEYRFLVSDAGLGMTTAKKWSSQADTAVRLLYPMFKRQPLLALLYTASISALLLAPFVVAVHGLMSAPFSTTTVLGCIAGILVLANYYLVLARTHPGTWWLGGLLWPLVAAQELVFTVSSLLQYEFGDVSWKGRNVCYPVLGLRSPALQRGGRRA